MVISRREFVGGTAAIAALSMARRSAFANPLGLPLGIQLYSVRQQMAEDLDGALAAIADAGYKEVEAASLPNKSAKEIRAALDRAGLRCVGSHRSLSDLRSRFDEIVSYDKELGVRFIVCPSPGYRTPAPVGKAGAHASLTLDDWHFSAEQFNAIGERARSFDIRFGYHNHIGEFSLTEGKIPYIELLRLTDPDKVTFELDCGWAIVGGMNPVDLLRNSPHRISMLHVKDFNFARNPASSANVPKVTELGRGVIDYRPIFLQAAKTQHIQHAFVEQEGFDMPWKESLRVDAAYMRNLSV